MSYYRGPAYPPRKRARGGMNIREYRLTIDYYDGGDRYRGPPRQSFEDSVLTRLRKDFISLADPVKTADFLWFIVETSDDGG